jgi:hypothetical protein
VGAQVAEYTIAETGRLRVRGHVGPLRRGRALSEGSECRTDDLGVTSCMNVLDVRVNGAEMLESR